MKILLGLAAVLGCADHGDCVPFSTCTRFDSQVAVTVQDANTAMPVAGTFSVNGAAADAACDCFGCASGDPPGACGHWILRFSSPTTDEQTYNVHVTAPGYAAQDFTVDVDYGNYQCASSSCPALASPFATTIMLQPG